MIDCNFENGNKSNMGLRHVTVGAIAINSLNQVLLVKRDLSLRRGGKYTIPGGFLDRDEDTRKGVVRELKEETGLDGEVGILFHINDSPLRPKEDRQNVDFVYAVKITGGKETLNKEVIEISWFDKSDLPHEDDFAFDHRSIILSYFDFLEKPFAVPVLGKA